MSSREHMKCLRGRAGALAALAALCTGVAASTAVAADVNNGVAGGVNVVTFPSFAVAPAANTSVANARILIADGTSVLQTVSSPPETRWFVFPAESGKSYVVEVINPAADLPSNAIQTVGVFNSDGASPPPEAQVDCTMSTVAPSLEIAADGVRCVIRTFVPASAPPTTVNKRGMFVSVLVNFGPSFQIRVRESTIYGRWTTNGYDFHTEVQNTTSESLCVQIAFFPGTGSTPPTGPTMFTTELTIPPHGAAKYVRPNGQLSGGDNKGTLRIIGCATLTAPKNFVPGSVHVSTYAYNPVTDKYLYFFTWAANNGAAANSW